MKKWVFLIFEKMLEMYFFRFLFLSLICNLQFKMFLGGIYLLINDIPFILCLLSVKWNICLTDFSLKNFVLSLELV